MTSEEIFAYNQDIVGKAKKNVILKKGFILHLPPGHEEKLLQKIGVIDKNPDRRADQAPAKKKSA